VGWGPSNPGYVTCGSTQCDLATTECCIPHPAASLGGPRCIPIGSGQCNGDIIQCDEPEDCPTGEVCGIGANEFMTTGCTTDALWRICKKDSDCGDAGGGVCVLQSCNQHSFYVSTCGVDQWCQNHP
jgi:hypothetical protein